MIILTLMNKRNVENAKNYITIIECALFLLWGFGATVEVKVKGETGRLSPPLSVTALD